MSVDSNITVRSGDGVVSPDASGNVVSERHITFCYISTCLCRIKDINRLAPQPGFLVRTYLPQSSITGPSSVFPGGDIPQHNTG